MLLLTDGQPSRTYFRVAEQGDVLADTRPRVYLDTTICSYLAARSQKDALSVQRQHITRDWWRHYRTRYQLCISAIVIKEASDGDPKYSRKRLRAMRGIQSLAPDPRMDDLLLRLIGKGLLPPTAHRDAAHIAIAAIHSMHYLLTWNYRHLANPHIARNVVRMCESQGLICPQICTPELLMRVHTHG